MNRQEKALRQAPFALRIVRRKDGKSAVVYRRRSDELGRPRLQRLGALSPIGFTAAIALLRDAVAHSDPPPGPNGRSAEQVLTVGAFHPLNEDWGARVACYILVANGLRDGERLMRSADHLQHADPIETAWWLGMLTRDNGQRAVRALRILTEAVE